MSFMAARSTIPVRIAMFTLRENYELENHRMNPETVSPLEGYLGTTFPPGQVEFTHIDSCYANPQDFLNETFDIVGINAHWRGIGPVKEVLRNWPLSSMAKYVFIEGSYIDCLKSGREVIMGLLRETGADAFIVYGEPEPAVSGLIEHIVYGRGLETIPNLVRPEDGWQGPGQTERTDLSKIPYQPYQYLTDLMSFPFHTFHVETSRGCHYGRCTFCTDARMWMGGWRGYPTENIVSLFEDMRHNRVDYAFIFDKDFWGNDLTRAKALAAALIESGNSIPYTVALRADEIIAGEDLLPSFKESGLAFVFVGAETFSESVARRYNKGITVADTLRAIQILRKHQIDFGLGYIIDPVGSLEELVESLEVVRRHRLWGHLSSIFNAMEIRNGTGYEMIARKAGILGQRNDDNLLHEYEFADLRVGTVVEVSKDWLRQVPHINVFLLLAKRMTHRVTGRDQHEYLKYYHYLHVSTKLILTSSHP